ncbi:hypothetical protein Hanom_Chr12g01122961 [Helianthus anomalus]
MQFRVTGPIPKEEMRVPHGVAWYESMMVLPNRFFGEQVLVAAGMSDKWPEDCESVLVLLLDGEALRDWEEFWLEQIRPNFMYARIEAFAIPPVTTEGARIPHPWPCRAISFLGKEIVYRSNEELKPKRVSKKKTTTARGAAVKKTEVAGVASDAASQKATSQRGGGCGQLGSTCSKGPDVEKTKVGPDDEELIRKNALKRSRVVARIESTPPAKKVATSKPIEKKGSLRSHYFEVSPEVVTKKPATRPKITILPPKTVVADQGKTGEGTKVGEKETDAAKVGKQPIDITLEVLETPEVVKVIEGVQPVTERVDPEARVENPIAQHTAPIQIEKITSTTRESAVGIHLEGQVKASTAGGGDAEGSGARARKDLLGKKLRGPSLIHAEDMLGDIYYKTYDDRAILFLSLGRVRNG